MNAKKSLSTISENRDLWIAQYRQEVAERDIRSGLSAAELRGMERGLAQGMERGIAQGMERGIAQGMERGIAQGAHKKALETAIVLKSARVDISIIAKSTGLTEEEIRAL